MRKKRSIQVLQHIKPRELRRTRQQSDFQSKGSGVDAQWPQPHLQPFLNQTSSPLPVHWGPICICTHCVALYESVCSMATWQIHSNLNRLSSGCVHKPVYLHHRAQWGSVWGYRVALPNSTEASELPLAVRLLCDLISISSLFSLIHHSSGFRSLSSPMSVQHKETVPTEAKLSLHTYPTWGGLPETMKVNTWVDPFVRPHTTSKRWTIGSVWLQLLQDR